MYLDQDSRLEGLDPSIIQNILGYCDAITLARVGRTCKYLNAGYGEPALWKPLLEELDILHPIVSLSRDDSKKDRIKYRDSMDSLQKWRKVEEEEAQLQKNHSRIEWAVTRSEKRSYALQPLLFILTLILVTVKLNGGNISWVEAFIPLYLSNLLFLSNVVHYIGGIILCPGAFRRARIYERTPGPLWYTSEGFGTYDPEALLFSSEPRRNACRALCSVTLSLWIVFSSVLPLSLDSFISGPVTLVLFIILCLAVLTFANVIIALAQRYSKIATLSHVLSISICLVSMIAVASMWYLKHEGLLSISYMLVMSPLYVADGVYLSLPFWVSRVEKMLVTQKPHEKTPSVEIHTLVVVVLVFPFLLCQIILGHLLDTDGNLSLAMIPIYVQVFILLIYSTCVTVDTT